MNIKVWFAVVRSLSQRYVSVVMCSLSVCCITAALCIFVFLKVNLLLNGSFIFPAVPLLSLCMLSLPAVRSLSFVFADPTVRPSPDPQTAAVFVTVLGSDESSSSDQLPVDGSGAPLQQPITNQSSQCVQVLLEKIDLPTLCAAEAKVVLEKTQFYSDSEAVQMFLNVTSIPETNDQPIIELPDEDTPTIEEDTPPTEEDEPVVSPQF